MLVEFLIALFGLLMLVAPWAIVLSWSIFASERYCPMSRVAPLDPETTRRDLLAYLYAQVARLKELGFERPLYLVWDEMAPRALSYLAVLNHRAERVAALVVVDVAYRGFIFETRDRRVQFCTYFREGSQVCTASSRGFFLPGGVGEWSVSHVPRASDPAELLRAHRAHVAEVRAGAEPIEPPRGDRVLDQLREDYRHELAAAAERSYLWVDGAGVYRPTRKGALVLAWRTLWPLLPIRRARRTPRRRRVLQTLDLPG